MAIDKYLDLPGIISELQDGGLQIFEESDVPSMLVLGTSKKGVTARPVPVERAQESESRFGLDGTLVRGMYESLSGGAENLHMMRIGARSAILYGVGTDNAITDPTSIETLLRDKDADSVYFVRYLTPATRGPNEVLGQLIIKNINDFVIYDSNPGGQLIDSGEVLVSGVYNGGADIGAAGDPDDFVAFEDVAQDSVAQEDTFAATLITPVLYSLGAVPDAGTLVVTVDAGGTPVVLATPADYALVGQDVTLTAAAALSADHETIDFDYEVAAAPTNEQFGPSVSVANFTLSQTPNAGTLSVSVDGDEVADADWTQVGTTLTFVDPTDTDNLEVIAGYEYDASSDYSLREGSDGDNPSKMELYEALEEGYELLESDEYKVVQPMGISFDCPNIVDGDAIVLSSDESIPVGRRFPVASATGDALGELFVEEYDGEFFYFWDTDNDGQANIFPLVGSASATTKIDGSALAAEDFKEVNFLYQLANYCFVSSTNEYNVIGSIGCSLPGSFSKKDIGKWVGKEPVYDVDGNIILNGSGLLGNKIAVGLVNHKDGLFATDLGWFPGAAGSESGGVLKDRAGRPIDIGKYVSLYVHPQTFFNPVDQTGFGYNANGSAYYGGFITTLLSKSAPTNKIAQGASSPVKLSKAKLNSLSKFGYVALKHKNRTLRFSDSPTAARKESDFRRLTTVRVVSDMIDTIREIAQPYIGEPNTQPARMSLEKNLREKLGKKLVLGFMQRFEIKVSATTAQTITGDMNVDFELVPPFEVRKIHVITSLAKE